MATSAKLKLVAKGEGIWKQVIGGDAEAHRDRQQLIKAQKSTCLIAKQVPLNAMGDWTSAPFSTPLSLAGERGNACFRPMSRWQ